MQINAASLQILTTGVQAIYQGAFNTFTPSVIYTQITTPTPSTTKEELYPWMGNNTSFREWLGDRVIQNMALHSYRIANRTFENTVGIDRDAIEDDSYGVYNPLFQQLGQDAAEHPDVLTFELLSQAGTMLCYDGKPFFSNAHPGVDSSKKKVTYSNDMGGDGPTWYLACTKKVLKPLIFQKRRDYQFTSLVNPTDPNVFNNKEFRFGVDGRCNVGFGLWQSMVRSNQPLNTDTYAAARAKMAGYLRDNGLPWNFVPDLLLVGPSNEGAANTITTASFIGQTGGGTTENVWKGTATALMTPRITW
jgi:phage major head subunit gpT-like protein